MLRDDCELLYRTIAALGLSARVVRCLGAEGIELVKDLVCHSGRELLRVRHCGEGGLREVREKLAGHGLGLRGDKVLPPLSVAARLDALERRVEDLEWECRGLG